MKGDLRLLADAYLRTSYVVHAGPVPIVLRVGERNPAADALAMEYGAGEWAFVTACNPHSVRLSDAGNGMRHERLRAWIGGRGLTALPGAGVGDGGDWPPEPSFLVLGIPRARARELGRLFGQNAVVVGRVGGAPELLWCLGGPETDEGEK